MDHIFFGKILFKSFSVWTTFFPLVSLHLCASLWIWAISYTVSDELSLTYGTESSDAGDTAVDAEFTGFTVAYTAGGMTLTGKMIEAENVNFATTAGDDVDYWSLGASFAF